MCGPIKVRYLPERVSRQFGYEQTIPRHPDATANILDTTRSPGYMTWYFRISHPYIIRIPGGHSVMPAESDAAVL
ncbi:hypothetical protein A2U01_0058344, partial [Trifolium medium]|nr:hypothetical protein [Trifolium medium]